MLSCIGNKWYLVTLLDFFLILSFILAQGGGVTKPVSSVLLFFNIVKTHISYWISRLYLTGVTPAAVTPVKYECDSTNLAGTSARLKILIIKKLTDKVLVTPTPEQSRNLNLWDTDRNINSFWPSGAIWRQRSGSTLAQVMACCLTAPSHYLNQCWLIISEVQWHSY